MTKLGMGRAAVAALLTLALTLFGATAANAAVTIAVSAPTQYAAGTSAKVSITVSGSYSGTAKLQWKSGTTWKTGTRLIAVTKGKATTTVAPTSSRTYRVKVGSSYSKSFTVKPVVPVLSAAVASATLTAGQSTKATLTVKPALAGTAKLQYKSGSTWVTANRVLSFSAGSASTTVTPSSTRTYRFVAFGRYSPTFTVTVVPGLPKSFTVTGSGWGHGVGMSQYGAHGMALEGSTAAQILTHYYTGTQVEAVDASGLIRVNVFGKSTDSADAVSLTVRSPGTGADANGQWRMNFYASGTETPTATWTGYNDEKLAATRVGTTVKITRASTGAVATAARVTLQWEATDAYLPESSENPYVELTTASGAAASHGQYRHGELELSAPNSKLLVVNTIALNTDYLYGIAEIPSSWSKEALKAQVIAARGFALQKKAAGVSAACACNLWDDSSSQNFSGWKKESEGTSAVYGKKWVAAVNETSGQVLTYGTGGVGKIATTYYFSSSGGQTENSENVWSSTVPYLRSVADPYSLKPAVNNPNATWTATLTQASVAADFGLPDVKTLVVTQRTSSASTAAAYVVTATSSTGVTKTITGADKIRIAFGLKSPWIWTVKANS